MTAESQPSLEARYSPVRSGLMGLLSLVFVALGLWMVGIIGEAPSETRRLPEWAIPIIGWFAIIFMGTFAVLHLKRALSPGLAIRVDAAGMLIMDYSSEPIPWEDFLKFGTQDVMGTKLVQFEVVEEREATFGAFRRLSMPSNRAMSGLGGSITTNNTTVRHKELVEAIRAHGPPQLTQYLR